MHNVSHAIFVKQKASESGNRKRKSLRQVHLSHKEYDEMLNMVLNRKTDWGVIFDLFHRKYLSVDDLLMGEDFFKIARECYNRNYSNINFGRGYVYSIQYHIVWCVKYRRYIQTQKER